MHTGKFVHPPRLLYVNAISARSHQQGSTGRSTLCYAAWKCDLATWTEVFAKALYVQLPT
jgi:hypothetical protein